MQDIWNVMTLTTSQVVTLAELCKKHAGEKACISQKISDSVIEVEFTFPHRYKVLEDGTICQRVIRL